MHINNEVEKLFMWPVLVHNLRSSRVKCGTGSRTQGAGETEERAGPLHAGGPQVS